MALKVFLTALAIADDLLAVLVIALFYTSTIAWGNLAFGGVFLMLLIAANVAGIRHPLVYSVLGIGGLWLAFLLSGVHATIAGVIAAMTIPARTRLTGREFLSRGKVLLERFEQVMSPGKPQLANRERQQIAHHMKTAVLQAETPLQQLEHTLHPWVTVVVMPVFALANAGITLDADIGAMLINPVAVGVILGLLVENQSASYSPPGSRYEEASPPYPPGVMAASLGRRVSCGNRIYDVALYHRIGVHARAIIDVREGGHPGGLDDGGNHRLAASEMHSTGISSSTRVPPAWHATQDDPQDGTTASGCR